jgi:hypothetical protein
MREERERKRGRRKGRKEKRDERKEKRKRKRCSQCIYKYELCMSSTHSPPHTHLHVPSKKNIPLSAIADEERTRAKPAQIKEQANYTPWTIPRTKNLHILNNHSYTRFKQLNTHTHIII